MKTVSHPKRIAVSAIAAFLAIIQCSDTDLNSLSTVATDRTEDASGTNTVGEQELDQAVIPGLKRELFFEAGGGGGPGPRCWDQSPNALLGLPALRSAGQLGEEGGICLMGFGFEELVRLDLYDPEGQLVQTTELQVGPLKDNEVRDVLQVSDGPQESRKVGVAEQVGELFIIQVFTWWPVTRAAGEWYAEATTSSGSASGPIRVSRPNGPSISVLPSVATSIVGYADCPEYHKEDELTIIATNLNMRPFISGQPIGIYRRDDDNVLRLVAGYLLDPGNDLELRISVSSDVLDVSRDYFAVAVISTSEDTFRLDGSGPGPSACFSIY